MSTWRRNACFSRGIGLKFHFLSKHANTSFFPVHCAPCFLPHCFYTFLVFPCIATLSAYICCPTEFWIIEPLVFQIFLVVYAYWADDS